MKINLKEKFVLFFISLFLVGFIVFFNVFSSLSNLYYDSLLNYSIKNKQANKDIVLITVDKKTVEKYGNESFWTRDRYTSLLNKLEKENPKVVYFDYYFSEKTNPEIVDWDLLQNSSKLTTETVDEFATNYYKELKNNNFFSSIDSAFVRTLKKYNNIVLPKLFRVDNNSITENVQIEPLAIFSNNSKVGYANVLPDNDGVIRGLHTVLNNKPVSQIIAELYLWNKKDLFLGYNLDFTKYVCNKNKLLINYFSEPYDKYTSIPFHNAYNGLFYDYNGELINLQDKIIIIGDYDESFGDVHKTPVGNGQLMSGMEIIANQVQTFIENKYIFKLDDIRYYLLILLVILIVFIFFIALRNYWLSILLLIFLLGSSFYGDYLLFNKLIYIDFVGVFLAIFIPFFIINLYKLYIDNKEKNNTRRFFSKYVEKGIVEELISSRKLPELHGIKKNITTFFTDIEGFTTITEKLSPEEIIGLLNNIFNRCNNIIFKNSGTLDKYIGDAIMAFWGAPKDLDNGAVLACTSALEMMDEIMLFNSSNTNHKIPKLNFRFGISTGEVTVGSIGNDQYSDYTVIGDKVNLASRLEGINKYYGTNIIICEDTYELIKDQFYTREIDFIKVKGKNNAIRIHELMCAKGISLNGKSRIIELINNQERGLECYRLGKWNEALEYFGINSTKLGDKVADVFISRIELLKKEKLRDDWDGIFVFDSK